MYKILTVTYFPTFENIVPIFDEKQVTFHEVTPKPN